MSLGESMVVAAFVVRVVVTDLVKLSRLVLRLIKWGIRKADAGMQKVLEDQNARRSVMNAGRAGNGGFHDTL